jgi:hypothetical protein
MINVSSGTFDSSPVRSAGFSVFLKKLSVQPGTIEKISSLGPMMQTIHQSSLAGRILLKLTLPRHFYRASYRCIPPGQILAFLPAPCGEALCCAQIIACAGGQSCSLLPTSIAGLTIPS